MANALKVYACVTGRSERLIVAAASKKRAYESFINSGIYHGGYASWNNFASETGNEAEIATAMSEIGRVFRGNEVVDINSKETLEQRFAELEGFTKEFTEIFDTAALVEEDSPHAAWAELARKIINYREQWIKP